MQEFNPLYIHPYKYNQWSKVPRGPVAAVVGSFLFGATATIAGTAITWGTIGGFLITTAVASWAIGALLPKPKGISGREGLLANRREPVGDFDIVYGKVRKGGVITFMESTGKKNKYLHFIIVLAGHQVEAIEDVYINENIVTLDSDGFVTGNAWKSKVRVKKMLGAPNQAAQPELLSETSVNSSFRGRGIAYLYVRLEYDREVFADGIPTFTAVVKGKKVFDPRTKTTVWSDNAALCIRDYLSDPLGVNSAQSPESLQSDSWTVGANVCDSLITKKNSSTEKRYTLNGIVSTANTPRENLQQMLTSCGGTLFWGQGQWQFKAGYFPSGPYVDLGMDDLRSGISLVTKNSRKENFNSVSGVFVNSEKDWIETEYPRFSSSVFLAQDNGQENSLDMELPFTTSPSAAQRLAKMAMFRSREEIVISANFSLKASKIKVGDVVRFSFERYGFTNKYFEVLSWKLVSESNGLVINMTMKETSADAYDWNAEEKDILGNNTTLPQPREGLAVSGLVVTNRQTLQSDGTLLGEVLLSWNPAENAFVYRYDVQWRKNVESAWSSTQTAETEVVIPSIKSGIPYTYRVRAVSVGGFVGAWEQIGATVSGKDTPPGLPTNVQTKNLYRAAQVTWNNPTDRDLNHIEIYANTTNTTTGATKVGESGGTKFIYDMEPMESRWFFLRAVDHSGNKSGFTAGKQGTALFIEQSDVDINVDQLLEDAGLNAVEVLPNLPTTDNYDGRTVYNTDDRQLYIYDGDTNQWKPAVEPFNPDDLILERDNFPADLKPVEVLSSLPTTGNFEGRVVMLLGDGKLYRYKNGAFTASVPTTDLVGTIGTSQIANNAINTAKFASGLRPVEVVSTLPTTGNVNGRTVVLTTDGKLYRYHSGSWTASVPSVDITGQLTNDQIAAVSAAKLTGQITGTQISDDAITTPKIAANAVIANNIAANAIVADKIASNAITSAKIEAGAVVAGKIATNAITTDKLDANAVTTAKIAAGAVNADQIAAGAIIASKLQVSDFTNLVPDNQLLDAAQWNVTNSSAASLRNSSSLGTKPSSSEGWWRLDGSQSGGNFIRPHSAWFPIYPGEQYFCSGEGWKQTGTTGNLMFHIQWADANKSGISVNNFFNRAATGGNQIQTGTFTAPATARFARVYITLTADADGAWVAASPIVRRVNGGELIVDGAITTNKLSANAVTADKIEANAITSDKIEANAITSGKIAAGAVAADKIAAGSILASKIAVMDFTNLVPDAEMVDSAAWTISNGWSFAAAGSSFRGSRWLVGDYSTVGSSSVYSGNLPVEVGEKYFVAMQLRANAAGANLRANARIRWKNRVGSVISTDNVFSGVLIDSASTVQELSNTLVAPSGSVYADIDFYLGGSSVSGTIILGGLMVRRVNGANLIVDGAITTDKLSANSVTTAKIEANAITAGLIAAGAVNTTALAANAVTAAKINVNDLSAISANLGSIQVGNANIADSAINSAKILDGTIETAKIANGAITNAKISGVIQSGDFATGENGAGWRIDKAGTAEFNNVIIRRQIEVASGAVNVGNFTPKGRILSGVSGSSTITYPSGESVDLENGPGMTKEVLATPISISAWQGAKRTYIATAGMTGAVNSSNTSNCYWGWTAEVLPLTKWSGNQSLRLKLDFWSKNVATVNNCVVTWKIYEVS